MQKHESAINILFFFNVEKEALQNSNHLKKNFFFFPEGKERFLVREKISVHGMSLTCLNSKFSLKLGKALITVILVMFLLLVTYNHMSFSVISMFGILTAISDLKSRDLCCLIQSWFGMDQTFYKFLFNE